MTLDLGVAYVIDGFNHKYHLNYRHKNVDPDAGGGISETCCSSVCSTCSL